jgi:RNA polymerase sigma-70 factor (ECF subfamily)
MTSAVDPATTLAEHRPMLLGLAYRLLGSVDDAEDVLQEAYLRWLRADRDGVREPRRYLSRVVTRLALAQLRVRRRTGYVGSWLPEPVDTAHTDLGPVDTAEARETLSMATLHLMERLNPPERAVYVLRTAFELPYADIGEILDRSEEHCRQLHHRAQGRLATDRPRHTPSRREHDQLLESFLHAARDGDLDGLRQLLGAQAIAWTDSGGKTRAARNPINGPDKVARFFIGIYQRYGSGMRVEPVELNGFPGALVHRETGVHALALRIDEGQIASVYVIANPDKLARLDRRERPV